MSDIITYNPWAGDGISIAPHRPSLAQLGGGAYQDDQDDPPDLDTMPSAEMENVNETTLSGIARVCDTAVFGVSFVAGAPQLDYAMCANENLGIPDFTVTDVSVGITDITWPADTFPTPVSPPCGLTMNEYTTASRRCAFAIPNGIRVTTKDEAGNGVDTAFTVCLK